MPEISLAESQKQFLAQLKMENVDWEVTKSIYLNSTENEIQISNNLTAETSSGSFEGRVSNIRPNNLNLIMISRIISDPKHSLQIVLEPEFKTFDLVFTFATCNDDDVPNRVAIEMEEPPVDDVVKDWYEWIAAHVQNLLVDSPSSSLVVDFVLNDSLEAYFQSKVSKLKHASILDLGNDACPSLVLEDGYSFLLDISSHFYKYTDKDKETSLKYTPKTPDVPLEMIALRYVWNTEKLKCPVCFDLTPFKDTTITTCGHRACTECITTYISSLLSRFEEFGDKFAFVCIDPSCKQPYSFEFIKAIATDARQFAAFKEYWVTEGWKSRVAISPNLPQCPRRKCHSFQMKRLYAHKPLIYCDVCGETWCERCLQPLKGMHACDETDVQLLCFQYISLDDEKKKRVDARHPWMAAYVSWKRADETSLLEWIDRNASQCPTCGLAIQKAEGCFHMECINCHTHYCYNCKLPFGLGQIYEHKCFKDPDIYLNNFAWID